MTGNAKRSAINSSNARSTNALRFAVQLTKLWAEQETPLENTGVPLFATKRFLVASITAQTYVI